jgi:hypothetical protein
MTEPATGGLDLEGAGEAAEVAVTGLHAAEGVSAAAAGNWDGAADSALSMSESALGVATVGLSTAAEEAWDTATKDTGLPTAHEGLNSVGHAVGGALGTGLENLVGDDQAHQSAVAFDDGDILGGLGHMAEGAATTVGDAVEQGAADVGQAIGDAASSVEQGAEDLWNDVTQ